MVLGAIIPIRSTAGQPLAVPVDIALRITAIIAILPVRGASTATPSTAEARLAPAAAHRPMTMPTTAIPMARGQERTIHSTSAPRRARLAEILAMNTLTMEIPTTMGNAMTAGLLFR